MKKKLIRLSPKEDLAVTRSAKSDPNARPFTDKQWNKIQPTLVRGRGRPLGTGTKKNKSL